MIKPDFWKRDSPIWMNKYRWYSRTVNRGCNDISAQPLKYDFSVYRVFIISSLHFRELRILTLRVLELSHCNCATPDVAMAETECLWQSTFSFYTPFSFIQLGRHLFDHTPTYFVPTSSSLTLMSVLFTGLNYKSF